MDFSGRWSQFRSSPLVHLALWQLGFAKSETQTTEVERDCLARYASGNRMLAEIGVYRGVTTFAQHLRRAAQLGCCSVEVLPCTVSYSFSLMRFGITSQDTRSGVALTGTTFAVASLMWMSGLRPFWP